MDNCPYDIVDHGIHIEVANFNFPLMWRLFLKIYDNSSKETKA